MNPEESDRIIKCPYCGRLFCDDPAAAICMTDRMCMVCGYTWRSRANSIPRRCPSCRSTEWNVSLREKVSCQMCGHEWVPRGGTRPYMCPRCKSTSWNGVVEKPKPFRDEDLQRAVVMYSQGMGCVDAAKETGVPLEAIVLKIISINDGPVRMKTPKR